MNLQITETTDCYLLAKLNEEIQTFHRQLNPYVFKPYNRVDVASFFKQILEQYGYRALVALDEAQPVGYVLLEVVHRPENAFQYARSFVLIDQLLVVEKYRKMGIAAALLDAVAGIAQSKQISTLELNHWTQNDAARKFFSQNGFEYYNEKMWKRIGN